MRRLDEPFYKSDLGFESIILDDILPLGSTAENETVAFDLYLVQSWKLLYCFFTLIGLMKFGVHFHLLLLGMYAERSGIWKYRL